MAKIIAQDGMVELDGDNEELLSLTQTILMAIAEVNEKEVSDILTVLCVANDMISDDIKKEMKKERESKIINFDEIKRGKK